PGAPSEWPKWAQNVGWAVLAVLGLAFGGVSLYAAYDLLGLLTLSIMLVLMAALYRWHESIYKGLTDLIITASAGWRRWAGVALTIVLFFGCPFYGWRLKVGDMTPGAA